MTDQLQTTLNDGTARLVLNRPKVINALTFEIFQGMLETLRNWAEDPGVERVEFAGAGERGFCAGADVRALAEYMQAGGDLLLPLATEYELDALIAEFPKPITAFMSGVTMGGGLGLCAPASRRIVNSTTKLAMPETKIGFFPDAGVLYWLSRGGAVGKHIALTSAVFGGGDAIRLGLADESSDGELPTPLFDAADEWIQECYASNDAVEIAEALAAHPHPDANQAAEQLRARSPLGVKVALRALHQAREMDHREVLAQDLKLVEQVLPIDFIEGVRALLVDRDNNPQWRYPTLEAVPDQVIEAIFER